VINAPLHFSALARRSSEPPITWLMKAALEKPNLISLAAGFTDNDTLPVAEVAALTREILRQPKIARPALQYGTTIGLPELRRQLLRRWQTQDAITTTKLTPADVVITNGSQQLLYLLTEELCDPGDVVLVENPTYFVYLGILEALGVRAYGFYSIEELKSKIQKLGSRLKLIYLVTYFQNPTGHTWSLNEKREALAIVKQHERAAGHPIYIVEDAAYRDLRFEGDDVPSFKSLDPGHKRVVYTNTLTKPFATGLRLGYGILPPALMAAVLRSKTNHDFGTANFLQTILARALADGLYERHLPRIAAGYRRKRDAMVAALEAAFPKNTRFEKPSGGLYVWVELPAKVKTGVNNWLFRRAFEAGVFYVPGEMCYCADPTRSIPQNAMRLSFGAPAVGQIKKGIRLLADALR
jgi:2-aminoadipate transaminase